jgi:exopolysaccharide production protein ExoQ
MSSTIATVIFAIGVGGLFYLDRDKSVRTSKALWLAVAWMWILGSRSISAWLEPNPLSPTSKNDSPIDQLVAASLILCALIVLFLRSRAVKTALNRRWPVLIYFSYCLLSAFWSDFPGQGLRRWVRAIGDLLMVLIITTDPQPIAALKRFFSRVGFVLLPASILMLRYYPLLSHGYDDWGMQMNTGVTTNKNMLGVSAFVLTLGASWQVLRLLRRKDAPDRRRHLLAQGTLLCFGISLLFDAHSATSGACFTLGVTIMVLTSLQMFRGRAGMVHALVACILLCSSLVVLLGGRDAAAKAVGRKADLTGRTEVWAMLIPMVPNPILGAGFENFWFGPRLEKLRHSEDDGSFRNFNEAHNGFIEVYLNLGLIGVGLIGLILFRGYSNATALFRDDPTIGCLPLAYLLTATIYSITEAGFRMGHPMWFFLLFATMARTEFAQPQGQEDVARASVRARNLEQNQPHLGRKLARKDAYFPTATRH